MSRLYRIMIVDDEEEVRTSIIKKIDWHGAGFELAGDAENGMDALEKIESLEPDLVLTDIRMPYMGGLTLAARLKQEHPSIKVIIFSGYDDFEYAKQAIQLNILEYILKPVNAEELTAILCKIRARLDEEEKELNDIDTLRAAFNKSLPILKENFLKNLIHGKISSQQISDLAADYQLDFAGSAWYSVALVSIQILPNKRTREDDKPELLLLSVRELLRRCLAPYCRFEIVNSSLGLCVIIGLHAKTELNEIMAVLRDAGKESEKVLSLLLTFGVGTPCSQFSELAACYYEARNALGYRAVLDGGTVIYSGDVEAGVKDSTHMDNQVEADLISAVKFGGTEQIQNCVDKIIADMQLAHLQFSSHQAYLISVMNTLLQIVQRNGLDAETIFGRTDFIETLSSLQNDDALRRWLLSACQKVNEAINSGRENSTRAMIRAARQYIEENYSDPSLSLETICTTLHISIAYFSSIFKREVGESYTGYLTKIRLEKALELLKTTDEKTYLIAHKVGYEEPNYFGYVFKKHYGMTPSQYRGQP